MRKLLFILTFLVSVPILSVAQKDTIQKPKIYKSWITLSGGHEEEGVLYETKDSSLVVVPYTYRTDLQASAIKKLNISFNNISSLKIRSKNSVKNGVLIGMSVGFVTGIITGVAVAYIEGDDIPVSGGGWFSNAFLMTAEEKARYYGTGLGVTGAILGAGIGGMVGGSLSIKIPIDGSFEKFNNNKKKLRGYSYIH